MKLERGEIIVLDNNKEYICVETKEFEDNSYVYFVSNFKPVEVKFAKELLDDNSLKLEIVNNQEQKIKLLKLFQGQ